VNDYAILSGNDGPRYVAHLRKLLDQGVPVGGIGCQGHFGKVVDGVHVRRTLDELAAFGLPIKLTEYDADVADEEVKAACLETLYTVAFGHPSVEGILMWGFWEGAHWKPRAAMWKRDFTTTPAAETYRRLLFEEWWTTASGRFEIPAFFGRHAVESGGRRVEGLLKKAEGRAELRLD
jgi:GH35 family endo-1,4-beta-xylanase